MREVFAPVSENSVAIPPKRTECIGPGCPEIARIGMCKEDTHHYFFPRSEYVSKGGVYSALRVSEHAVVTMARCRHDGKAKQAQHNMFTRVAFPRRDVAVRFLEVTLACALWKSDANSIGSHANRFLTRQASTRPYNSGQAIEHIEKGQQDYDSLILSVQEIQVIPSRIVQSSLDEIRMLKVEANHLLRQF